MTDCLIRDGKPSSPCSEFCSSCFLRCLIRLLLERRYRVLSLICRGLIALPGSLLPTCSLLRCQSQFMANFLIYMGANGSFCLVLCCFWWDRRFRGQLKR